jgi:hypothetical protein
LVRKSKDGLGNSNHISTGGVIFHGDIYLAMVNNGVGSSIWQYLLNPHVYIPAVSR